MEHVLSAIDELESGAEDELGDPLGADKLPPFWETNELEEL